MATSVNMLTMPICFFILGVYLSFSMGLKEAMGFLYEVKTWKVFF